MNSLNHADICATLFFYIRILLVIVLIVAIISFTIGMFLPSSIRKSLISELFEHIIQVEFSITGIFLNNLAVAFTQFLGGLLFGIPTLILTIQNFTILGALYSQMSVQKLNFIITILPHGIFEFGAAIFSAVLGFILTLKIVRFGYIRFYNYREVFLQAFKYFILIVLPLLIIAAVIEVAITPRLIEKFGVSFLIEYLIE